MDYAYIYILVCAYILFDLVAMHPIPSLVFLMLKGEKKW